MYSPRRALSRRAVLRLGLGGLLAGCRPGRSNRVRPPAADPDSALAVVVRTAETDLIAAYDTTIARFPLLSAPLRPLRAEHGEHLAAVSKPVGGRAASRGSQPVPDDPAAAIRFLLAAERAAALARITDCLAASPRLAPLVASIGASEAAHAAVLTGVRVPR